MRDEEKFAREWRNLIWMLNFHKKPFWLVPTVDDYIVSVIKPLAENLPEGTASHLYALVEDGEPIVLETVRFVRKQNETKT
jgi:hypothetical protein